MTKHCTPDDLAGPPTLNPSLGCTVGGRQAQTHITSSSVGKTQAENASNSHKQSFNMIIMQVCSHRVSVSNDCNQAASSQLWNDSNQWYISGFPCFRSMQLNSDPVSLIYLSSEHSDSIWVWVCSCSGINTITFNTSLIIYQHMATGKEKWHLHSGDKWAHTNTSQIYSFFLINIWCLNKIYC